MNSKYQWNFPHANGGQFFGISDSGIETFKDDPISSLAREICQNSLDARNNPDIPVIVEFKSFKILPKEIPDVENLKIIFKEAYSFWKKEGQKTATDFFRRGYMRLDNQNEPMDCLRISDFNTTGLIGAAKPFNSPWANLIKASGVSNKSNSQGGSFGIGKFAPFSCSEIRTVLYSTSDIKGTEASQGVSRLTSYTRYTGSIFKKEDMVQGIGFLEGPKANLPAFTQLSVDPKFQRMKNQFGTDLFILDFIHIEKWKQKLAAAVLDSFFYAIFLGNLIVKIDNIEINKKNLNKEIKAYREYEQEETLQYAEALFGNSAKVFNNSFLQSGRNGEITGDLVFHASINPEFSRKVAMIRETGMKIYDRNRIRGDMAFAGILFVKGDSLNSYLKTLENPQHKNWEVKRAKNQTFAKNVLKALRDHVNKNLDLMLQEDGKEQFDPLVGLFTSDLFQNEEKKESITDSGIITSFKEHLISSNTSDKEKVAGSLNTVNTQEEKKDIPKMHHNHESEREKGSQNGMKTTNKTKENPREDESTVPVSNQGLTQEDIGLEVRQAETKSSKQAIPLSECQLIVKNYRDGQYRLILNSGIGPQKVVLEINYVTEGGLVPVDILEARVSGSKNTLDVERNKIRDVEFLESQRIYVDFIIHNDSVCSLDIKAYAE